MAKIALNYIAYRKGGAYARDSRFDALREYIKGNNLLLPNATPGGIAVDERFVTGIARGTLNMFATKSHLVSILEIAGVLTGAVTLYAGYTFIVKLGPPDGEFLPIGHEFSTDGSWNRELSLDELIARRRAASVSEVPESSGLADQEEQ